MGKTIGTTFTTPTEKATANRWFTFAVTNFFTLGGTSFGTLLFSEDFGHLPDATPITTANTGFTYVKPSTGTYSALEAQNPGFFTGASLLIGSQSAVGVADGFAPFEVGQFSFDFRFVPGGKPGSPFYFELGSGSTFSGDNGYAIEDLMARFRIFDGFESETSAGYWTTAGLLQPSNAFNLCVYFNGSSLA